MTHSYMYMYLWAWVTSICIISDQGMLVQDSEQALSRGYKT